MCNSKADGGQRCDGTHDDDGDVYWSTFRARNRARYAAKHPNRGVGGRKALPADAGTPQKRPLSAPAMNPTLVLAPVPEVQPIPDATAAIGAYVKPERCDKCGARLYPGEGMIAIGVLCNRCYADDPYDEEPARTKPKRVWHAPYTAKKAWGESSTPRIRALVQAPVLTAQGDPLPKGATLTERDGTCWKCHEPVKAGRAEVVWITHLHSQRASCPTCTWAGAYTMMIWPAITDEQALGVALQGHSLSLLHQAEKAGYGIDEILSGILTPAVIADLPIAIALNAADRT